MNTFTPAARRRARQLALQALYQGHLSATQVEEIRLQFHQFVNMKKVDVDYFHELLQQISITTGELDELFIPHLDRPLKDINPIELMILRIGAYELAKRPDVPYRVVINEALELAKVYGATEAHKYINGILDKLAHQLRNTQAES